MAKRGHPMLEGNPIQSFSPHGGPQRKRCGGHNRFGAEKQRRFLDALTLTCNVGMSADHAGVHIATPYRVRGQDPVFAAQWREALDMGLERLEALVIEHGGAGLPLDVADPDRALADGAPPFDFDRAIQALQLFAKLRAGVARKPNVPAPSAADTDAAITVLIGKFRTKAKAEPALLAAPDEAEPALLAAPDGADAA